MKKGFKYRAFFTFLLIVFALLSIESVPISDSGTFLKYKDGMILGSLVIMGAYFLVYYFIYKEDKRSLSYSLMCLIMIVRTVLYNDDLTLRMFSGISSDLLIWITHLTIFCFPAALFLLIQNAAIAETKRRFSRMIYFYTIGISIITAFIPAAVYTRWTSHYELLGNLIILIAVGIIFKACSRGVEGAEIILMGSMIVFISGIQDMLYHANLIRSTYGEITPIGLAVFMFLISFLMADRFVKTYRKVDTLSDELTDKLKKEQILTEKLLALDQTKDAFNIRYDGTSPEHTPYDEPIHFNILAVDDDSANLQALRNVLLLLGYEVKGVKNGVEALENLDRQTDIDLVIMDIMMPEMSGIKVLEKIREKYNMAELPVLMLTAKNKKEYISLCFQMGANDFLSKPFESEELSARVRSLVKLKKTATQLVLAEMSFLQAQIKPHFIHNSLGTIASICTYDPERARELILDLSDYLRGSFDLRSNHGLTVLSKEFELIQAYLSIEQARFGNRLKVYCQLTENMNQPVPLLTIQPLVENAVHHGVMCKAEGGQIRITVERVDSRIRIEVRDNGIGMSAAELGNLFNRDNGRRGVGIANINRRLTALYGEGLSIESDQQHGTTVFFFIPARQEEKEGD